MATLTLRILTNSGDITKGSTLSSAELDQNLISLNNELATKSPISKPTFMSSTADDFSYVNIKPSGTGWGSELLSFGLNDTLNSPWLSFGNDNTTSYIISGKNGTGSMQPLIFMVNSQTRLSLDTNGNVRFPALGTRITGDFSNATVTNRVMFQTSTVNAGTVISVLPNGTASSGHFRAYGNSDPTNASFVGINSNGSSDVRVTSDREGSGAYLPMTFYTGGSERLRIDTNGNVGLAVTPNSNWSTSTKKVFQIGAGGFLYGDGTTTDQLVLGANSYFDGTNVRYSTTSTASRIFVGNGTMMFSVAPSGTAGDVVPFVNAMVINNTGTVSLGNNATTGAGLNIHSQNTSWSLFRASATSASYSTFYKGGAATAVGYIGTDGGGISSGGTGDNFGVRAEGELILASGSAVRARFNTTGHFVPEVTNTYDLGSTSLRWRNIYTQDLHLSNGIGDYTVVEGVENLYLVNNKTNKSFKFALIEVDPAEVPEKSKVA